MMAGLHSTRIEWTDFTWNPVTGCLHGCPYCYARRQIDRFRPHPCERPEAEAVIRKCGDKCFEVDAPVRLVDERGNYIRSTPWPKGFAPTMYRYTLDYPAKRLIPSRIFVSSMGDLFGEWVPDAWIEGVFEAAEKAPQHTYLFLTKNPSRYLDMALAKSLPERENFWYGTTVTGPENPFFSGSAIPFSRAYGYKTFLSIEPVLEPFPRESQNGMNPFYMRSIGWVIIGAMTGPGSKFHQPKREWIENVVKACSDADVPVFMKDSLKPIWGPDLIRQHPDGMVWPEDNKNR